MPKLLLKQKIIISSICLGLFFSLVLSFAIFYYFNDFLIKKELQYNSSINIEQAHENYAIFKDNFLFAKMLSERIRVKEYLLSRSESLRAEVENVFLEYAKGDDKFLSIYLLDKNGFGLISSDPRFVGQDYSFRDYFKKALAGERFTEVLIGKTTNEFGYYYSSPVYGNGGEVIGVLAVKIKKDDIDNSILNGESAKKNTVMLVDQYGIVLSSNRPERFLKSLGILLESEKAAIKESDKFLGRPIEALQYDKIQKIVRDYKSPQSLEINDEIDGEIELVSVDKIGDLPFYLVVEAGTEEIEAMAFKTVGIMVLIIFLWLFLLSLVIAKLVEYFIKPLEKIKSFSQAIAKGDFAKKIKIKSRDEIGEMFAILNKMTGDLEVLYAGLDKKIIEKTSEVSQKNKILKEQKKAILNVLQDVEREKNKTKSLARDLEKFKLAVDNASDHIVITNAEGIVLYVNKGVERITGFSGEEVIGHKVGSKENWGGLMNKEVYENLWNTIKKEKKVFIGELSNKRKNGEKYEAVASISPILNKSGEVIFFIGIERDITREKEIDKVKTEFVSLASHQLRTPLATINWYVEMLLGGDLGKLEEGQIAYLQEVYRGSKRMVELVNALLNVSRLELGTFMIEPKEADIKEISDIAIKELEHKIEEKKIDFSKKYDPAIGKNLLDEKLALIIFQNLLSNAVKYTPDGGKISLEINKKENDLEIIVADNGLGIPAAQQDKIYDKLFRADNVKETDTEGTGLGLYIVKEIIKQSGGSINFSSEQNKGTTFRVYIPLSGMKEKKGSKSLG